MANGFGYIFIENDKNGFLSEMTRKKLISISVQFMVSIFGEHPTKKDKVSVATVISELFPCLPLVSTEHSIQKSCSILTNYFYQDLLVHSKGGFLDNAFKRLHASSKEKRPAQSTNDQQPVDEAAAAIGNINLEDQKRASTDENSPSELVRSLKGTVVNEQNMDMIKTTLRETIEYRSEMVKNDNLDCRVEFPYFFTCPDLVIFIEMIIFVEMSSIHICKIYLSMNILFRLFLISAYDIHMCTVMLFRISGRSME